MVQWAFGQSRTHLAPTLPFHIFKYDQENAKWQLTGRKEKGEAPSFGNGPLFPINKETVISWLTTIFTEQPLFLLCSFSSAKAESEVEQWENTHPSETA